MDRELFRCSSVKPLSKRRAMIHFTVRPDQYASFQVLSANDHWNVLTPNTHKLLARLVNGDYAVLEDSDAAGGVVVNDADNQTIRVADIDTTAKTLKVLDVETEEAGRRRGGRRSLRR